MVGPDLKPDSETPDLKKACIDCHSPLRTNDFVFTTVAWDHWLAPRWFGGVIPGAVKSVEFASVTAGDDYRPEYVYERSERKSTSVGSIAGRKHPYGTCRLSPRTKCDIDAIVRSTSAVLAESGVANSGLNNHLSQ